MSCPFELDAEARVSPSSFYEKVAYCNMKFPDRIPLSCQSRNKGLTYEPLEGGCDSRVGLNLEEGVFRHAEYEEVTLVRMEFSERCLVLVIGFYQLVNRNNNRQRDQCI